MAGATGGFCHAGGNDIRISDVDNPYDVDNTGVQTAQAQKERSYEQ
jgi:hypothetical protein